MTNKIKNPAPNGKLGFSNSYSVNDNSLPTQRQRLLTWLRERPITTLEARQQLNILAPAPRIFELRKHGFNIVTHRITATTPEGKKRFGIARYILLSSRNERVSNGK